MGEALSVKWMEYSKNRLNALLEKGRVSFFISSVFLPAPSFNIWKILSNSSTLRCKLYCHVTSVYRIFQILRLEHSTRAKCMQPFTITTTVARFSQKFLVYTSVLICNVSKTESFFCVFLLLTSSQLILRWTSHVTWRLNVLDGSLSDFAYIRWSFPRKSHVSFSELNFQRFDVSNNAGSLVYFYFNFLSIELILGWTNHVTWRLNVLEILERFCHM